MTGGSTDGPGPVAQWQYEALARFRLELRRYLSFAQEAASRHGVSMEQHQAMLAIRASSGRSLSVGELAKLLFLRHHSTVELINRLSRLGMVERRRDQLDNRRINLVLTSRGEETLGRLAASHLAELSCHGPQLVDSLSTIVTPPHDNG